ncbi:hypothetical protein MKW98_005754 [Papaver atlanticum]|uniref:Uncharacterized protein n=1 Tax=Papaver atlanticum TaxID=357466 RepID=A0AAD4RZD7_9MAGN|nr:hypothetical protein MKW98_005754 [Papaver atlanticum]
MDQVSSSIEFSVRGVRKGAWCEKEDLLLRRCIEKYGEGKWRQVPLRAGLNRCRKSCRLRWCNYLKPNIKRGEFEADELDLIMRMHKLLGNRQVDKLAKLWSIIAGRLPGRTANDIKNLYNTRLKKKCFFKSNSEEEQVVIIKKLGDQTKNDHGNYNHRRQVRKSRLPRPNMSTAADDCNDNRTMTKVLRPLPRSFTNKSQMVTSSSTGMNNNNNAMGTTFPNINDMTRFSAALADEHHDQFSSNNEQQISDTNNPVLMKNTFFGETQEEGSLKKKHKKKNKGITSAAVDFENNTSCFGVEKRMMKFTVGDENESNDHDQHVYNCNFDGDQGVNECGNDNYWNDLYFDYNSWGALGEEQD